MVAVIWVKARVTVCIACGVARYLRQGEHASFHWETGSGCNVTEVPNQTVSRGWVSVRAPFNMHAPRGTWGSLAIASPREKKYRARLGHLPSSSLRPAGAPAATFFAAS